MPLWRLSEWIAIIIVALTHAAKRQKEHGKSDKNAFNQLIALASYVFRFI
jgi:hypothetical protein